MSGSFLSCTACLRRALLATASRGSKPMYEINAGRQIASNLPPNSLPPRRRFTTATAISDNSVVTDAPQSFQVQDADPGLDRRKNRERLERIVKKHLKHMEAEDPWQVAQYVEQTLARDRFDEAYLLTQMVSKNKEVVVAWNHLIDYQLGQQQLRKAISLYNEMKKRAQLPNVQTFTIIFRGLAKSQHPKLAVAEAVKHYNILLKDKRLQPNSTHLNAVLNVCAKAGDLDSLFLIADTVDGGARAPTSYTYTTILNALRHHALRDLADLPEEQQLANIQKVIERAKTIWIEVSGKWKHAKLIIDEELVCAMGRILLMAPTKEGKREVLDLLYQTMSIPNLAIESGEEAFHDSKMENIAVSGSSKSVPLTKSVYAVPGRNTLALVLTVLASSKLTVCGIKYWNLMVRHYGIVPDNDNWLRLLGMLKVAKASAHAASIVTIIPDEYINEKHFRIAMETCVRDNINPNVIKNSEKIRTSMMERLKVPDPHTARLYLRVALVSHFNLRKKAQSGKEDAAKREYGLQITAALAHLWEPYKQAHYHYFKVLAKDRPVPTPAPTRNPLDGRRGSLGAPYNGKREVISLARSMYSSFNKVINERMLPEQELRDIRPVAAKINREIQLFYSNREEHEPKLGRDTFSSRNESGNGDEDFDTGFRQGGDFVWDTTKPMEMREFRDSRSRDSYRERRRAPY